MTFWIEAVGFAGSGFAVLTYWMRDMTRLRIAAVLSCIFFIVYAVLIGSYPLLAMELVLLPINAYRLVESRNVATHSRSFEDIGECRTDRSSDARDARRYRRSPS